MNLIAVSFVVCFKMSFILRSVVLDVEKNIFNISSHFFEHYVKNMLNIGINSRFQGNNKGWWNNKAEIRKNDVWCSCMIFPSMLALPLRNFSSKGWSVHNFQFSGKKRLFRIFFGMEDEVISNIYSKAEETLDKFDWHLQEAYIFIWCDSFHTQ